jgi:hypothetical protein
MGPVFSVTSLVTWDLITFTSRSEIHILIRVNPVHTLSSYFCDHTSLLLGKTLVTEANRRHVGLQNEGSVSDQVYGNVSGYRRDASLVETVLRKKPRNSNKFQQNKYIVNISLRSMLAGPSDRTVSSVGLDRLDAETVGSDPAWGMDVCPRLLIIIINLSPSNLRYII